MKPAAEMATPAQQRLVEEESERGARLAKEQEEEWKEFKKKDGMAKLVDKYAEEMKHMDPAAKVDMAKKVCRHISNAAKVDPAAAIRPRTCAQCFKRGAGHRCGRCRRVRYCDADCQRRHWSRRCFSFLSPPATRRARRKVHKALSRGGGFKSKLSNASVHGM